MREIKFRGKRVDNREWVYGYIFSFPFNDNVKEYRIINFFNNENHEYEVDPSTVGQYTGLKDKNGKKIYEGDVCLVSLRYFDIKDEKAKVIFNNGCFCFQYGFSDEYVKSYSAWDVNSIEIIGNIYKNL